MPTWSRAVKALMAERTVIIADGHHRYETAVAYAARHPDAQQKMMAFFTLQAPGLTIFPNHRLVHDVVGFTLPTLLERAAALVRRHPAGGSARLHAESRAPRRRGRQARPRRSRCAPDAAADIPWPPGTSPAWRSLAVSVLHEGLLRPLLGIDDAKLDARTNVDYTADQAEAVRWARDGRYQAAFLIAPTTPDELQAVVRGGEVLPQKSTHFYPKLLDGLVFHLLGS